MFYLVDKFTMGFDAPSPWGIYFQDSATPQMEGLVELHDNIMYYLVIILFGVGWILLSIVRNYINRINMNYYTCSYININSFPFIQVIISNGWS